MILYENSTTQLNFPLRRHEQIFFENVKLGLIQFDPRVFINIVKSGPPYVELELYKFFINFTINIFPFKLICAPNRTQIDCLQFFR